MKRYLLTSTLIMLLIWSGGALAQDTSSHECGNVAIGDAINRYDYGQFTECIRSLNHCLDTKGFNYDQLISAYKLKAMCYLALDSVDEADKWITKLISLNEGYEADVRDPQRFRLQLAYIRTQMRANLTSSVSKKMENIDLAPATIQIITAKDIEDRGYTDIESMFNDLPGFDITRDFGISYSVLYQRGYRAPALTERTMIMIDGVEDNDLWTNAAFITKQYPISNVKRVEVIYGPASTIYGANAFCGVINIVTKDEDDIFTDTSKSAHIDKPKNTAINLQAGYASYNTKYVDGTIGLRNKNIFFSVTGRLYVSDGVDLSSQSYWDGTPTFGNTAYTNKLTMKYSADSAAKYVGQYFQVSPDSSKIVPTAAALQKADSLDKAGYKTALKNASNFKDPINDFYISSKLVIHHFKFGFQYWNKNEGSVGDYVDNYAAMNSAYTNWQVREYFVYAQYDNKVSEQVDLTSFTYYRHCDFGDNSRVATFSGYGNGALSDNALMNNVLPHFGITNYYESSSELRSELKAQYVINDKFDLLGGTEFTTDELQANYLTSAKSPAVIYGLAPDSAGGNNITEYTISGYATGSYKNTAKRFNIDLGGRVDNNRFREIDGYGTVFNPRADVVCYPGSFVFKAIYAEAFLNASNQNKFSTATSRLLDNPTLAPERVKNFEVSGRYKFGKGKRDYVELAAYRAYYTNSLSLVQVTLPGGVATHQYQDIGKSLVYGAQLASEVFINAGISFYGNLTFTDPTSIFTNATGRDSTVRTGDIATVSANAGVNIPFWKKKFNLNTRANIVGDKPTGSGTSVSANPYTKIDGYTLLNATLGYRVTKNILVQVACNNILNTVYYSPGVRTADGSVYAPEVIQPSRNFMARVIVDLKK